MSLPEACQLHPEVPSKVLSPGSWAIGESSARSAREDSSIYTHIYISLYIYMWLFFLYFIYTRIFACAPRALDSPIAHDRGLNTLDGTSGCSWQASGRDTHAPPDKSHVQKHTTEDGDTHMATGHLPCFPPRYPLKKNQINGKRRPTDHPSNRKSVRRQSVQSY